MLMVRFKVQVQPDKVDEVEAAFQEVLASTRKLDGVVHFDIARDISDPHSFIATEVFEDRAALDRQEAQDEVAKALAVLQQGAAAAPEATLFEIASSAPHG
jgi:quinol monooxygenase YgiN